jgi:hypothetical protein
MDVFDVSETKQCQRGVSFQAIKIPKTYLLPNCVRTRQEDGNGNAANSHLKMYPQFFHPLQFLLITTTNL